MRAGRDERQPDLFAWRAVAEIYAERRELIQRIASHKPNSHRRVELLARLQALTVEQLKREDDQ